MVDPVTEIVFKVIGEHVFSRAFQFVLSRREATLLARAAVADEGFKEVDKARLLRKQEYLLKFLESLRPRNQALGNSLEQIVRNPANLEKIQDSITRHPFLTTTVQEEQGRKRFVILGHSQAGKTTLIYRILYALARNQEVGTLTSQTEPSEIPDRTKRYAEYHEHLKALARRNDQIDKGSFAEATPEERVFNFYLDLEFYKADWLIRAQTFDYAGSRIEDFYKLAELVGDQLVDGVIVIVDCHRLIFTDLLEIASAKEIVNAQHKEEYKSKIDKVLEDLTELTSSMMLRLDFLRRERDHLPVTFVLNKFDGFQGYDLTETAAKKKIYAKIGATLEEIANQKRYSLSICLVSSFGQTVFARDEKGDLMYDSWGVPAHVPKGPFPFNECAGIVLPLLFLVQAAVLDRISRAKSAILRHVSTLSLWRRWRLNPTLSKVFSHFEEEARRWKAVTQPDANFLTIEPNDTNAVDKIRAFFQK